MKICPHCNKEINEKAIKCIHCGQYISNQAIFESLPPEQQVELVRHTKRNLFYLGLIAVAIGAVGLYYLINVMPHSSINRMWAFGILISISFLGGGGITILRSFATFDVGDLGK